MTEKLTEQCFIQSILERRKIMNETNYNTFKFTFSAGYFLSVSVTVSLGYDSDVITATIACQNFTESLNTKVIKELMTNC